MPVFFTLLILNGCCVNTQHMKKPSVTVNQTLISSLNTIFSHLTSTAASCSQNGGHGGESTHQRLHGPLKGKKTAHSCCRVISKEVSEAVGDELDSSHPFGTHGREAERLPEGLAWVPSWVSHTPLGLPEWTTICPCCLPKAGLMEYWRSSKTSEKD